MTRFTPIVALAFLLFASATISSPVPAPNAENTEERGWCSRCYNHFPGAVPGDQ
ncbi:hypothetical protein GYMLUDRAFT_69806 [Collybiopsis luxurians FD-317 M1]|nr:hypothetical protein GYMLUDRAFT_69806 [Collybiopsis luxurians FD-317 M1]